MANVLIRDLDERVLSRLKSAAKAHGRSLQEEIHEALQRASTRSMAETRRLARQWLKRLRASSQSDSTRLIRDVRDKQRA
jgi:plasmid stability protein